MGKEEDMEEGEAVTEEVDTLHGGGGGYGGGRGGGGGYGGGGRGGAVTVGEEVYVFACQSHHQPLHTLFLDHTLSPTHLFPHRHMEGGPSR